MSEKSIPDLVLATLRMHAAKAEMDLIRVKDELDRTTVATARSRVLRGLRDQLTAQRDAWEYLVVVAGSEHYRAYQEIKNGTGAWEMGSDGISRKCADCKGPMDDLGGTQ